MKTSFSSLAAVGLTFFICGAFSFAVYDREVLRELRDQLRTLDEEDRIVEEQRRDEQAALEDEDSEAGSFVERNSEDEQSLSERAEPETSVADLDLQKCPPCRKSSTCCRLGGVFACCSKIYKTGEEEIEIDEDMNLVTFYYKNGAIRIVDFKKGLISGYSPDDKSCYVAPGLDFTIDDVIQAAEGKGSKDNKVTHEHYYSKVENARPLEDKSLLPDALQERCNEKPFYWHEKVKEDKVSTRGLSKRWCICISEECSEACNRIEPEEVGNIYRK